MEPIQIEKDIKVFYVTASAFPEGILDAHKQLHKLVPFTAGRRYFGISRPEEGNGIVYRAATEEMTPGEAASYKCDTLVLKKGAYICETVTGFQRNPLLIEETFQHLLDQPGLDPQGYCVELYTNEDDKVKCMIRMAE